MTAFFYSFAALAVTLGGHRAVGAEEYLGTDGAAPSKQKAVIDRRYNKSAARTGRRRTTLPVAAKIAFVIAGMIGGTGGSPMP